MNTTVTNAAQFDPSVRSESLWRSGLRAGLVSSGVNAGIYVGAALGGVFPYIMKIDPTEPGLTVLAVVLVSMAASLAAMGVWTIVARWTKRPFRTFVWIAGVVLILSFAAPYAVPGTTTAQAWVQNLLHVVVAAAVLWEVRGRGR